VVVGSMPVGAHCYPAIIDSGRPPLRTRSLASRKWTAS
jgi:hypothetical protein